MMVIDFDGLNIYQTWYQVGYRLLEICWKLLEIAGNLLEICWKMFFIEEKEPNPQQK